MINRIVLVGRLVADPEARYTPSGVAVTNFRIAVDRPFTNPQGEREADFINIVTWRQTAEFAANYLTKGRLVAVDGRLQMRSYTDRDGNRRTAAEVVADNVRPLDSKRDDGGGARPGGHDAPEESDPPDLDPFSAE
jgi:single-strand DNA-binding protein